MRYKCLILDHDDTCFDSTAPLHYPAHLKVMSQIRPSVKPVSLETWFIKNCEPGVTAFLTDELGFTHDELQYEYEVWREFVRDKIPDFFPGIPELLKSFREKGGAISIVSHSNVEVIERIYSIKAPGLMPDLIFGWDEDPDKRKPHPWPAQETISRLGLKPEEALIVDDLLPGIHMAKSAGIACAAAGWGHQIPFIQDRMKGVCDYYFDSVGKLQNFLFI